MQRTAAERLRKGERSVPLPPEYGFAGLPGVLVDGAALGDFVRENPSLRGVGSVPQERLVVRRPIRPFKRFGDAWMCYLRVGTPKQCV